MLSHSESGVLGTLEGSGYRHSVHVVQTEDKLSCLQSPPGSPASVSRLAGSVCTQADRLTRALVLPSGDPELWSLESGQKRSSTPRQKSDRIYDCMVRPARLACLPRLSLARARVVTLYLFPPRPRHAARGDRRAAKRHKRGQATHQDTAPASLSGRTPDCLIVLLRLLDRWARSKPLGADLAPGQSYLIDRAASRALLCASCQVIIHSLYSTQARVLDFGSLC